MKYLIPITAVLTTCVSSAFSQHITYVTAAPQGCTVTANCTGPNTDGTYTEHLAGFILGDFGARGTAAGRPSLRPAPRGYISSTDITDPAFGVDLLPALEPNKVYKIDYNFSSVAGNTTTNAIFSATATDADLSFSETDKYQRSFGNPANQWQTIGYITNGAGTPTISFRYASGLINGGAQNRMLWDTWRFTEAIPCLTTPIVSVVGPLSTNLQQVVVAGVTNATKITVYQDTGSGMAEIGAATTGIVDGNNTVTVAGLVKGAQVAATQTVAEQEGCVPTLGIEVGGGANPSVRVALNIRENTALTGPAGAAGSGGILHFLGSSGVLPRVDALNGAPSEGFVLTPSTNWQTVSFTNGSSTLFTWFGTDASPGTWDGEFGALDGIAFASEGESGPFDIYIDDLANGVNGVIQDWETAEVGSSAHGFNIPYTGSGTTAGDLLREPDIAEVVNTAAFSGTNSLRVRFQFKDNNNGRWLRLVTTGATPVANPQVQSTEPISFKILILPVGENLPPVGPPGPLSIIRDGNNVILSWPGTGILQSATDVTGPYDNVDGANNPYTNAASGQTFYRLIQ